MTWISTRRRRKRKQEEEDKEEEKNKAEEQEKDCGVERQGVVTYCIILITSLDIYHLTRSEHLQQLCLKCFLYENS